MYYINQNKLSYLQKQRTLDSCSWQHGLICCPPSMTAENLPWPLRAGAALMAKSSAVTKGG